MSEPVLEREDIQGGILRGYPYAQACHLFAAVRDPAAARGWIDEHAERVTCAARAEDEPPDSALNLAFCFDGLRALGVPEDVLERFPPEFQEGMEARAGLLGDDGVNAPERWERGLRAGAFHLLVVLHARRPDHLAALVDATRAGMRRDGLELVHAQWAAQLPDGREHFGFADGFSQPALAGSASEPLRGQGRPTAGGGWAHVMPGEFLLGYVDEDGVVPTCTPPPFHRNSTYMVWRKLHQDVPAFRAFCAAHAHLLPRGAEHVAAKLIGRWPDGSSLVAHPDAPGGRPEDAERAELAALLNDFRYAGDPDGRACPLGAHVRRSYPRDALDPRREGHLTRRHRLLRRGMSYGPPLGTEPGDEGADRGLVFVCYQADIERQFEVVQGHWCADGDAFGLDRCRDALLGGEDAWTTVPGDPPVFLGPQPRLVTCRGGGYFLAPSLSAIQALASARWEAVV